MATKLVRHSGVQKEILHLYANFFRVLRTKQDQRAAISEYPLYIFYYNSTIHFTV